MQFTLSKKAALYCSILMCSASYSSAAEITLISLETGEEISGDFQALSNGVFTVSTEFGERKIDTSLVDCVGAACPDEIVNVFSIEGEFEATGELQRFEGGLYYINTDYGVINVPANGSVCEGEQCRADYEAVGGLRIAGSGALSSDLLPALRQGFTSVTATLPRRVEVAGLSSDTALLALQQSEADIAITERRVRDAEIDQLAASAAGNVVDPDQESVIALDALLFVVSEQNPLQTLGQEQISDVFSGRITDWGQLGGDPGPITVYAPDEATGTSQGLIDLVMTPARAQMSNAIVRVPTEADVTRAVAADPRAIGVTSYSQREGAQALDVRATCGIQMPASEFSIKSEEYPFVRRMYMYQPAGDVPELDNAFVDFVMSDTGQQIVAGTSYVDQLVTTANLNEQGLRFLSAVLPNDAEGSYQDIQGMMQEMEAAERLSLTFRFNLGSSQLDARAQGDLQRLAEMLNRGDFRNQELILIGFTDSIGSQANNLNLSAARAAQVRTALLRVAGENRVDDLRILDAGYGELSPLGCNDSDQGRQINRRVEVWVRDIVRDRT